MEAGEGRNGSLAGWAASDRGMPYIDDAMLLLGDVAQGYGMFRSGADKPVGFVESAGEHCAIDWRLPSAIERLLERLATIFDLARAS